MIIMIRKLLQSTESLKAKIHLSVTWSYNISKCFKGCFFFKFFLKNWACNLRNYTWLPCMHPGCVSKLASVPELTSCVVLLCTVRKLLQIPLKAVLSWWLHDLQNTTVNNAETMHWTKGALIKLCTNQVLFFKDMWWCDPLLWNLLKYNWSFLQCWYQGLTLMAGHVILGFSCE